jgi:hypothetical protein
MAMKGIALKALEASHNLNPALPLSEVAAALEDVAILPEKFKPFLKTFGEEP